MEHASLISYSIARNPAKLFPRQYSYDAVTEMIVIVIVPTLTMDTKTKSQTKIQRIQVLLICDFVPDTV